MSPSSTPIVFCGAGPGDPDLITVKGQQALARADLIVYAGSLVPEAVLRWAGPEAETVNSAGMHLDDIVSTMAGAWKAGRRVVRLHTGDPSLYGAIGEQMAALDRMGIACEVVPGVTAAMAAAAAMKMEFTVPEATQTLILTRMAGRTPVPDSEALAGLAAHGASMAIYLSMALVDRVAAELAATYGAEAPCAVACRVSHPEQVILRCTVGELAQRVKSAGIQRLAVILVGPALTAAEKGPQQASKLYDKGFSHGYRKS